MAEDSLSEPAASAPFRLAYVEGVTPAKWLRIWAQRGYRPIELVPTSDADDDQVRVLRDHRALMTFVRLPIDPAGLHAIPLYEEQPVVVFSKDHVFAAVDAVTLADLVGEVVHPRHPAADAVALAAAGAGVVVLPQSVARLHARRDVLTRPVTDATPTPIALAWLAEDTARTAADELDIEEFIGVVRGRTERSSRGAAPLEPVALSSTARPDARAGQNRRRSVRGERNRQNPRRPKRR